MRAVPDDRLRSVDAWRLVAIVAVVAIHATPDALTALPADAMWGEPGFFVNQLARFAVPMFFVISGYFWGRGRRTSGPFARRLLVVFGIWSLVYLLPIDGWTDGQGDWTDPFRTAWWHLVALAADPVRLLFQGTWGHLWFVPALLWALGVTTLFARCRWEGALIVLAIGLYLCALLMKPYGSGPAETDLAFNARNGPFFSLIFFVTGYRLSQVARGRAWFAVGLVLFLAGTLVHFAELRFLSIRLGTSPIQDFVIGTYPMGVGAALMALSGIDGPWTARLGRWGRHVFGIYLVHEIYVTLLEPPIDRWSDGFATHLLLMATVLACSIATVILLARHARTAWIVA